MPLAGLPEQPGSSFDLTWAACPLLEPSGHPASLFPWARADLTCLYIKRRPVICAYTQLCYSERVPTTLLTVSRALALPFQRIKPKHPRASRSGVDERELFENQSTISFDPLESKVLGANLNASDFSHNLESGEWCWRSCQVPKQPFVLACHQQKDKIFNRVITQEGKELRWK